MQVFLVGGAVRDKLLDIEVKDRDFLVTNSTPDNMLAKGFTQVGKDFPVFLHPTTAEEYALARTERKQGIGYTGFTCYAGEDVTLEDDLARRDLTINAIAQATDGELIDPYRGQQDLADKVLRHISPAFSEDPLRVLRVARFAARFAQLGFSIAPETMLLMSDIAASGELQSLTPERVWIETEKALRTDSPQVYFQVLRDCGALAALFPEIDNLYGVPAPKRWHPEIDTGIHTLMVVEQACLLSDSVAFRFACLVHDLGKALTPESEWPSHKGHGIKGLAVIKKFCKRLKVPNECRDLALLVSEHHTNIHSAFELRASTMVGIMDKCDAWRKPQRFQQMLQCCVADSKGRTGFELLPYPTADYMWQAFQQALTADIQAIIKQGFQGQEIRNKLQQQRIDLVQDFKNNNPKPT
ncbi:multifunctional CCA addition/repair protein [Psychromonas sp. 14N.309.X.WAT.B.A12]|uniref:multifunctional CCA addition/repair protein n=1 Tax=Psychromonas sp. 14N.309.X.WAT.B.A12 TaxID=2998322 RepID=UPI0025B1B5FF|nr:multifunctional CCA addition/repair protein [Psychromonas sp. 14N.309.X.WAT.B.A12]MDN2664046.1 multifunctional CCA addition/repair protein [Psychromonas sp. 14N.309.X.WAT.B.A12]